MMPASYGVYTTLALKELKPYVKITHITKAQNLKFRNLETWRFTGKKFIYPLPIIYIFIIIPLNCLK